VEEIARIVAQIQACWPATRIILRADSGFAREALSASRTMPTPVPATRAGIMASIVLKQNHTSTRAAIRATASERLRKDEVVTVLLWIRLSRKPRHIAGPTFTINGESAGLIELFGH
jgi:hypothetical protein